MAGGKNMIVADDGTFDELVLRSDQPVLVEFGATWCPPCRALEPTLAKIAEERAGQVKVVTVDTEAAPAVARRYGIRGVPTTMAFVDGAQRGKILGLTTKEKLLALLP